MVADTGSLEVIKQGIFLLSYLYFPAAILLVVIAMRSRGLRRSTALMVLAGLSVLAYARFIEPRILLTRHHQFEIEQCTNQSGTVRLAIFSDTHNGLFANAMSIDRIARRINTNHPDVVLVPGDFTYYLNPDRFDETFRALSMINAPVYAVLGNHDVGLPGPNLRTPLVNALQTIGVTMIENSSTQLTTQAGPIELIGLSDLWENKQAHALLTAKRSMPRLVLTHNPETIWQTSPGSLDLLIAGHTHGGQIYLPFITCALLDIACNVTRYGFKKTQNGTVFVTSGTGMVGLPMRFNVPPRIDIVTLTVPACTD